MLVVYLGAVAVPYAERESTHVNITSFGDSLWWAATTITSVGYGDRYPVTTEGRLDAVLLMLVGIALLSVLTAGIAAWFVRQSSEAAEAKASALMIAEVEALSAIEIAGQRRIDDELGEVLTSIAALDARLRDIQRRASSTRP